MYKPYICACLEVLDGIRAIRREFLYLITFSALDWEPGLALTVYWFRCVKALLSQRQQNLVT